MIRFPIPVVLVAFYLASACATMCRTPCGLAVTEGNCAALQHFEGRVTQRLAQAVPTWPEEKICSSLEGWLVRIHRHDDVLDKGCGEDAWRRDADPKKECILGLTEFDKKVITLETTDWVPSSFAHEVAHVAGVAITQDKQHCRWGDMWFRGALSELNGRGDWTVPEPSCSH